ncbi:MAG: hypothetical protein HQK51_20220, partial [Oligoflexia bacterium]|nr:hypothetical protein [Oligoflexia bacterium]
MKIHCKLISVKNPYDLPEDALPTKKLQMINNDQEIKNLSLFENLIETFNENGDDLISEIFFQSLIKQDIHIQVIATHGIPEPFDAWSSVYYNNTAFFFNLDLWPENDLKRSGLAVIKHEATHVL